MTKAKSQWQFGELFSPAQTRRVRTVSELASALKRLLEKDIGRVWVSGEISNLRAQSSGHVYFTLKDASAQMQCVCFRDDARASRPLLQDGRQVLLQADATLYEPRGQCQLVVRAVEALGEGALQIAFDALKRKLAAEGLFDPALKRPLPKYPRGVGVVTSPTGAALRDVIHVAHRRHPGLRIVLAASRVQGEGAAAEIVAGIKNLNSWAAQAEAAGQPSLDVILITRGGGSLEDLWAFNEEIVARAVRESRLPVVSAVGHEIDFTISDFAADLRTATPSAAAELLTEGFIAARQWIYETRDRLDRAASGRVEAELESFDALRARLARAHPRRWLNDQWQRLDESRESLLLHARLGWGRHAQASRALARRFLRIRLGQSLVERRQRLRDAARRLGSLALRQLEARRQRLSAAQSRLSLLGPQNVLRRGYSITTDASTGRILRSALQAPPGVLLHTRLADGEVLSRAVAPGDAAQPGE